MIKAGFQYRKAKLGPLTNTFPIKCNIYDNVITMYLHFSDDRSPGSSYDIALVKTSQTVILGPHVNTICLDDGRVSAGQQCYVSGWGKTHRDSRKHTPHICNDHMFGDYISTCGYYVVFKIVCNVSRLPVHQRCRAFHTNYLHYFRFL